LDSPRRAVLVTGASTGIGAATVELLAQRGWTAFAGVRSDAAGAAIAARHANITPVTLDVTVEATIAAAATIVRESGVPLHGVVNNAGIAIGGPLEFLPIDELRRQFETNVFGAIAVSQAFLPMLRQHRGRIVFVGSIAGRIPVPFIAPYSASKFALRSLARALRKELAPSGMFVSLIEPGAVRTPIWQKGRDSKQELLARFSPEGLRLYASVPDRLERQTLREERIGMPPAAVAAVIERALTDRIPRVCYLVGMQARIGSVIEKLPAGLRDRLLPG